MNIKLYEYVLTVADTGSFVGAAKRLGVTQSYLSRQIQVIEASFGAELFDRSKVPIRITPLGELFVMTARRILDEERQMAQEMLDLENAPGGTLSIGLSAYRSAYLLPKILPTFYRKRRGTNVSLTECPVEQIEQLVLSGDVDIAVTVAAEFHPDIIQLSVSREELLLALPPDHPLNSCPEFAGERIPTIELNRLEDTGFILLEDGTSLNRTAMRLFSDSDFSPQSIIEARSLESVHSLVIAGLGASLIPSTMVLPDSVKRQPRYYRVAGHPMGRGIVVAYRRDRYLSDAARTFIDILREVYAEDGIC